MMPSKRVWLIVSAFSLLGACGGSSSGGKTGPSGVCAYTLMLSTTTLPGTGGQGTATVVPVGSSSCLWSAVSDPNWLTLSGTTSGSGQQTFTYSAGANNTANQLNGTIRVSWDGGSAQQTVTEPVNQAKAPCVSLNSHAQLVDVSGSSGSVSVTASCAWTAASSDPSWLHITSGSSGPGNGTIAFTADGNANKPARTGAITVTGGDASDALIIDQPTGVVEARFTYRKTSNTNPGACEVLDNSPTDANARVVIKCEFDASSSVNSVFIRSYTFTFDAKSLTLGTTKVVTDPKSGCGFPTANTQTPFPVTLTVTTSSGDTKTQTQQVPFIKPASC